jgi:hypothetical protein
MQKTIAIAVLVVVSIGYNFYQYFQNTNYQSIVQTSILRENINDDSFRELILGYQNSNSLELAKNQGRIEGILLVVSKQKLEESDLSQIWHDGYYRGMEQNKLTNELKIQHINELKKEIKK